MTINCRRCKAKNVSLNEVRDFHGHSFAVVCSDCARELQNKLDSLPCAVLFIQPSIYREKQLDKILGAKLNP